MAFLLLSMFSLDRSQFYSFNFSLRMGILAYRTVVTVVNMSWKMNAHMCGLVPCALEISTMRGNELTLVFRNAKLIYSKDITLHHSLM